MINFPSSPTLNQEEILAGRTYQFNGTAWVVVASEGSGGPAIEQGKHTIWIPASAMVPRTTFGAGSSSTETTTNKIMLNTLDFSTSANEYAQFMVRMPKSWNEGTVTASFTWTFLASSGTVTWGIQAVAFSNGEPSEAAFGTAQTVTYNTTTADPDDATGDIIMTAETSAITIAGTPAAEDLVSFQVYRDVTDSLNADANLIGVSLYLTINAANDGV